MPTMVLTPEEFAKLPWYARQKVVNAQLRAARRAAEVPPEQAMLDWAEQTRDHARQLLAVMPSDPDAATHRAAAL